MQRSGISPPRFLVERGHNVLDIGSGWGGLSLYLAEMTGANITGITLSTEQLQTSNARATENNMTRSTNSCSRTIAIFPGSFDRIVSVGMFEHVGVDHYDTFFKRCAELLEPTA